MPEARSIAIVATLARIVFALTAIAITRADEPWIVFLEMPGGGADAKNFSKDGMTIVGHANYDAFAWNPKDDLYLIDGANGTFYAVSYDGTTCFAEMSRTFHLGSWSTETDDWTDLGHEGDGLLPSDCSENGSTVVGTSDISGMPPRFTAFRWTPDFGVQLLGKVQNKWDTLAFGVSGDGNVIVGRADDPNHQVTPGMWKWTEDGGFEMLPSLWEQHPNGIPRGVNYDGSVIVGWCTRPDRGDRAVRWLNGEVQELSDVPYDNKVAWDVSDDGLVIVGLTGDASRRSWLWTANRGIVFTDDFLSSEFGLDVQGRTLADGFVSADGLNFAGSTPDYKYLWIAHVPTMCDRTRGDLDCSGAVDFSDIDPFVVALISQDDYAQQYPDCDSCAADVNRDGAVDFNDIDLFVECLIDGGCS